MIYDKKSMELIFSVKMTEYKVFPLIFQSEQLMLLVHQVMILSCGIGCLAT